MDEFNYHYHRPDPAKTLTVV